MLYGPGWTYQMTTSTMQSIAVKPNDAGGTRSGPPGVYLYNIPSHALVLWTFVIAMIRKWSRPGCRVTSSGTIWHEETFWRRFDEAFFGCLVSLLLVPVPIYKDDERASYCKDTLCYSS